MKSHRAALILVQVSIVAGLLGAAGAAGAQQCGARVTVRQTGMKPNEDGTRTLRYEARIDADKGAVACTRVKFQVMRSYVRPDGSTSVEGIPMMVDAKHRAIVEGEDVLPTTKLVYWWADGVSCEPCPEIAAKDAKDSKDIPKGDQVAGAE